MLFGKDRPKLLWGLIAIVFLNILFFSLCYLLLPTMRRQLVSENCCLEILKAALYLATLILSLLFYTNLRKRIGAKPLLFAAVVGFIGFCEEISYGQALLHWKVPFMPPGSNVSSACITDKNRLQRIRKCFKPTHIVHCAGVCDLDVCEDRPDWAYAMNVEGTRIVGEVFGDLPILYMSTEYLSLRSCRQR